MLVPKNCDSPRKHPHFCSCNIDYYEVLRSMMTEWVAAIKPRLSEFARAEEALAKFKELLDREDA